MRHALALATLAVLGCGGSQPVATPAPAAPSSAPTTGDARAKCASAIAAAAKTGRAGEEFSPEDQAANAEVETAMTEGCVATSWPDTVLLCLTNGTTRDELRLCTEMLTEAQRQDFMDRVVAATKPAPAR